MFCCKVLIFLVASTAICHAFPGMNSYLGMDKNSDEEGQFEGPKSTNCSCGWTNKARIVGGRETLVNEYPLVVGLKTTDYDGIFCGGTIITMYHVLTAAHCTYPIRGQKLWAIVGEHDQTKKYETTSTEVIPVEKVIEHESYNHNMYSNDISLLLLSQKIKFHQTVGPACLPAKPKDLVNEQIKVIGWGALKSYGEGSNVLMKVNLKVVPIEQCVEYFPKKIIPTVRRKQICTNGDKKDSCSGDSGGPLLWLDPETNRYTLVALVSYGKALCATRAPAVNTDVFEYMDWIQKNVAASKPGAQTCAKIG